MKKVFFIIMLLFIGSYLFSQTEKTKPKKIISKKTFEIKAEKPNFMFQLARKKSKSDIEFDKKLRQKLKKSNRLLY